jgi:hypothetical protein
MRLALVLMERDVIPKLVDEIEDLKQHVAKQTALVERHVGDELYEEKATLRNFIMQLAGLQLKLRMLHTRALAKLRRNNF